MGPSSPSLLSYLGHIQAGEFGDPAAAAFLVAPDSPHGDGTRLSARDLSEAKPAMPERVYLGGCEGAGFGTSLEWSSIGAAALALGTDLVLAHRWPIIDGRHAELVDANLIAILAYEADPAAHLSAHMSQWYSTWRANPHAGVPPHFWSGLQVIGRSLRKI
jgi:hypothetical protein